MRLWRVEGQKYERDGNHEQRGTGSLHASHDRLVLSSDLGTACWSSVGVCGRANEGKPAALPAKGGAHRAVRDERDGGSALPLQLACEQEQRLHVTARAEGDEEDAGAGVLWWQLPGEAVVVLHGGTCSLQVAQLGARSWRCLANMKANIHES